MRRRKMQIKVEALENDEIKEFKCFIGSSVEVAVSGGGFFNYILTTLAKPHITCVRIKKD